MRVAVLDDWQQVAQSCTDWTPLRARADVESFASPFNGEDEAANRLAAFDIVLAVRERTPFPASLSSRLPNLKMFGLTGARAALIDVAAMIDRGVTVCYTGGGPSGAATAEITLGLMLAAARRIPQGDAAVRAGRFQQGVPAGYLLGGKTIGVIGHGRIGGLVARYCLSIDMRV
jgi:phosphoglycerate dehydrogenase-like enzyme